jgi:2-aminoadipate transaminase
MKSSAIREILKVTERPEIISFAGGLPAPDAFPTEEVAEAAARILRDQGACALQYGPTEGYRPLREWVAERMHSAGAAVTVEQVLITTGSQQALDLIGRVLIDEGDQILVESPTYLAALQAWSPMGARYLVVPSDDDGLCLDALVPLLARGPKLLYCLPNFQNPSGVTLSAERRSRLVELAAVHDVPILEDDPYRELRFEGGHLPRLISVAAGRRGARSNYDGTIVYSSTFSKVLSPGLRVGYVVGPRELIAKLTQAKQAADLHTATLNQMLVYEMARTGVIERNAEVVASLYRARRDAMLAALRDLFPPGVTWTHPAGGMFLWITLPAGLDAAELLRDAVAHNVAFVPGAPFHARGGGENTLRLNFSHSTPDRIREGIARLARVLETCAAPALLA